MTKLEELVKSGIPADCDEDYDEKTVRILRQYITDRFGPLVEISKIVGSEKIYPFSPAKVREAVAHAEEE
mgnify:FL=1